jgi:hypothetical protein
LQNITFPCAYTHEQMEVSLREAEADYPYKVYFFVEKGNIFKNCCIFALSFYHTAQVTKTVSVDVFDSDEHNKAGGSLRPFNYIKS